MAGDFHWTVLTTPAHSCSERGGGARGVLVGVLEALAPRPVLSLAAHAAFLQNTHFKKLKFEKRPGVDDQVL